MESYYENRPSLWISPVGNWGEGRLQLIQIHTDEEIHDNIVAFWVPSSIPEIGVPLSFDYRMSWHHFSDGGRPPAGRVVSTRTALGKMWGLKKFVIDFAGGTLESLSADQPLTGVVNVGSNAELIEQHLSKNRVNGRWRLVFEIGPIKKTPEEIKTMQNPVELRAFLKLGEDVLTETWSYVYEP